MSDSVIPSVEDIRKLADVPVFVVEGDLEWMEGPALLEGNDCGAVMEFADAVDAKVILVQYDYPDFDDYFVDPEDYPIEDFFEDDEIDDLFESIEEKNDEFENFLEEEYDGEPIGCSVYVMYDGTPYGMFVQDDALIEAFGETADEFLVRKYLEYGDDEEEEEDGEED